MKRTREVTKKTQTPITKHYQGNLWPRRQLKKRYMGRNFVYKFVKVKDGVKWFNVVGHEHLGEFAQYEIANIKPVQFEYWNKEKGQRI